MSVRQVFPQGKWEIPASSSHRFAKVLDPPRPRVAPSRELPASERDERIAELTRTFGQKLLARVRGKEDQERLAATEKLKNAIDEYNQFEARLQKMVAEHKATEEQYQKEQIAHKEATQRGLHQWRVHAREYAREKEKATEWTHTLLAKVRQCKAELAVQEQKAAAATTPNQEPGEFIRLTYGEPLRSAHERPARCGRDHQWVLLHGAEALQELDNWAPFFRDHGVDRHGASRLIRNAMASDWEPSEQDEHMAHQLFFIIPHSE